VLTQALLALLVLWLGAGLFALLLVAYYAVCVWPHLRRGPLGVTLYGYLFNGALTLLLGPLTVRLHARTLRQGMLQLARQQHVERD
jgi:hypothetical protein